MLDTKKYRPAVGRGGPEQAGHDGICEPPLNKEISPDEQAKLADELASVRRHLEHRAATNAIISEWRDELQTRIRRNQLRYELIGLSADEHDQLVNEVGEFKHLCRVLSWSPAGRRRE
jgi:hypothetical protein